MSDRVKWRFEPNPNRYRRLLNLLFGEPLQPDRAPDMEGGRAA